MIFSSLRLLTHSMWAPSDAPPFWYQMHPMDSRDNWSKHRVSIEKHGGTPLYTPANPLSHHPRIVMGDVELFYGTTHVTTNIFLTNHMQSWGPFSPCQATQTLYQDEHLPQLFLSSAIPFPAPLGSKIRIRQWNSPDVTAVLTCRLNYDLRETHGLLILDTPLTPPGPLWSIIWDDDVPLQTICACHNKLVPRNQRIPQRIWSRHRGTALSKTSATLCGIPQGLFPIQRFGPYPWLVAEWLGPASAIEALRSQGWVLGTPFLKAVDLSWGLTNPAAQHSKATIWMTGADDPQPFFVRRPQSEYGAFTSPGFVPRHQDHALRWKGLKTSDGFTLKTEAALSVQGQTNDWPAPDVVVMDPVLHRDVQHQIDAYVSGIYHRDLTWVVAFHIFETRSDIARLVEDFEPLCTQATSWEVKGWH